MYTFTNDWWLKLIPAYINENDSYKDVDNEGILQRYISMLGSELDNNTVRFIHDFLDNITPLLATDNLRTHLAYTLGKPPHIGLTETQFKYLLAMCITIYKWKGSTNSYKALFLLLGYYIEIFTDPVEDVLYDGADTNYDEELLYDTVCVTCVPYWIMIAPVTDDPTVPEFTDLSDTEWATLLELTEGIKCWLEPINADFQGLIRTIFLRETAELTITEDLEVTKYTYSYYDDGLFYDDAEVYDDEVALVVYP